MSKKLRGPAAVVERGKRLAPVRVRLRRINCEYARPYPPDGQAREWWQRLKNAFGTASSAFVDASLQQLIAAARLPRSGISEIAVNASLAFIEGAKPQGEVQCALLMQMACTHSAAMSVLGTFAGREHERNSPLKAATASRLLRAYATQAETLRRLKNGGSQVVRVEHLHVNEGGQALIGNVRKDGSGEQDRSPTLDSSSQSKSEHDAKQVAHAPHPTLRSPNAERELVPGAGDAERPISDARRTVAGSPEEQ